MRAGKKQNFTISKRIFSPIVCRFGRIWGQFQAKMADNLADKEKRCLPNKKYLSGKNHLGTIGAGDGGRTHTVSPPTDFESVSSANSNTPAYVSTLLVYQPHAKLSRHPRRDFADKFSDFFCQKALTNGFHAAIIISVA